MTGIRITFRNISGGQFIQELPQPTAEQFFKEIYKNIYKIIFQFLR